MKNIAILSIPDVYTNNIIHQLENLDIKKIINIYQNPDEFLNNYTSNLYDLIIVDSTLYENLHISLEDLINELRTLEPNVPIVIISLIKDYNLIDRLKNQSKIYFFQKLDDNSKAFENLLIDSTWAEQQTTPVASPLEQKKNKILVVDDFENTRFIVKFTLEKAGYAVITAADGLEAMQKLKQNPDIDLLIVDLNMPRMDGLQLIEAVRNEQLLKDKPIIILTTEIDPRKKQKAKQLKITGWIQKPYKLNEFLDIIKKVLS